MSVGAESKARRAGSHTDRGGVIPGAQVEWIIRGRSQLLPSRDYKGRDAAEPWSTATSHMEQHVLEHCCATRPFNHLAVVLLSECLLLLLTKGSGRRMMGREGLGR